VCFSVQAQAVMISNSRNHSILNTIVEHDDRACRLSLSYQIICILFPLVVPAVDVVDV
jgi:hypothetical protein